MEFLIISGLSGAGKSRTVDIFEDLNYYCVDNMPVQLIPKFAELCFAAGSTYDHVALVTDIRERDGIDELIRTLDELKSAANDCKILFVEADVGTIVRRYKETRRPHPLMGEGSLESAIVKEIRLLRPVRDRADYVIDTSKLTLGMLQNTIAKNVLGESWERGLEVEIISFGFKHGIPIEADLIFDVRFLPNPFYVPELRSQSGLDPDVYAYVLAQEMTSEFLDKLSGLIDFLIPHYIEEGKFGLTIGVGCTGGRHRSVAISSALSQHINNSGYKAFQKNRDIDK
jgi:UPF0042 nucleotide-binding protein